MSCKPWVIVGLVILILWLSSKRKLPEENYLSDEEIEEMIEWEKNN